MSELLSPEPYLVAYVDLLGSRELITTGNYISFLRVIDDFYDIIKKHSKSEVFSKVMKGFKFRAFSDNFVMALPILNDIQQDYNSFIVLSEYLSSFQLLYLLHTNILLRGGITVNNCIFTEDIVFGEALLRGVQLEEEIAIYPRIIIDPDCETISNYLTSDDSELINELFPNDKDGLTYINCFTRKNADLINDAPEKYKYSINEIILQNINNPKINEKAKQKWIWMYNHYSCNKAFYDNGGY